MNMVDIPDYELFKETTQFDPLRDLDEMFKEFQVLREPEPEINLDALFKEFPVLRDLELEIKMDVLEDDRTYTVRAEIPGVTMEDIKMAVDGNEVSISAEVKDAKEETVGKKVICSERRYGSVYRSFTLDHEVDPDAAKAKYTNGVLELTLPKKPEAAGEEIKVL